MKSTKALIVLDANNSDFTGLSKYTKNRLIIGCDGGANYLLANNIKPDVIIGDLDSVSFGPKFTNATLPNEIVEDGILYIKHPEEKDLTDSEMALDYAVEKGSKEIIIFGLSGDQVDHVISNVFMIGKQKYKNANIKIIDGDKEIFIIEGKTKLKGQIGQMISLMPIFGEVKVNSSSGLKYDPSKYSMSVEKNIGTRNVFSDEIATIDIKSGKFLVIRYLNGIL